MTDVKAWPVPATCHACGQKSVQKHCQTASPNCLWMTCTRIECKAVSGFVIDKSRPGQAPLYKPVFIYGKAA